METTGVRGNDETNEHSKTSKFNNMITIFNYNGPLGMNPNVWTNWTVDQPKTERQEYRIMEVLNTFINSIPPHSNN